MKFVCCLIIGFFITASLRSQNCKALESKSFFKSIQFGKPFPTRVFGCSNVQKLQYSSQADYRLAYDHLDEDCKKRYSDIFTFISTPFDFLEVNTNTRGQIFRAGLFSFFDDTRHDSTDYAPSANFTNAYNKIVSLFGNPTKTELATGSDSLFFKAMGMPRIVEWECSNIQLQLRVRYGSDKKDLNVLAIQITDRQFEYVEQIHEAQ